MRVEERVSRKAFGKKCHVGKGKAQTRGLGTSFPGREASRVTSGVRAPSSVGRGRRAEMERGRYKARTRRRKESVAIIG